MAGIVLYGCYIPRYRIDRRLIYKAMGWLNPATFLPGEKAVADFDEDSLTMAVAAATDCLGDIDRNKIDAVYFATSTAPYTERQGAEIIATAIDARSDIRSADFSDTPKAGTTALLSALDAVRAGLQVRSWYARAIRGTPKPGAHRKRSLEMLRPQFLWVRTTL